MIKALIAILLCLPLLSIAPVPRVQLATGSRAALRPQASSPKPQASCSWDTAPARLRQRIVDSAGVPFGEVAAWSCDGDSTAVIAELQTRAAAMQSEASAYRAAHPLAR